MLKFPCLILDHDDTVVQSEATINYPFFCKILDQFRPGQTISLQDYVQGCSDFGFVEMCRRRFCFTDRELEEEYKGWKAYIQDHVPLPFPGIERIIHRQKQEGGLVCVISMSSQENILRDYRTHFDCEPDCIYGWDLEAEHRKPSPYAVHALMKAYHLRPEDILVIDDMKPAWEMSRAAGVKIGFAGWGRLDYPLIRKEMTALCDYSFFSTSQLEQFLFDG